MKPLALICGAIGVLTVAAVVLAALFFLVEGSMVMAIFILAVVGIPAIGFCAIMFSCAAAFGVVGIARTDGKTSATPSAALNRAGVACFAGVALWSVPFGLLAFVQIVTDAQDKGTYIAYWLIPAGGLFALGQVLRRRAIAR